MERSAVSHIWPLSTAKTKALILIHIGSCHESKQTQVSFANLGHPPSQLWLEMHDIGRRALRKVVPTIPFRWDTLFTNAEFACAPSNG